MVNVRFYVVNVKQVISFTIFLLRKDHHVLKSFTWLHCKVCKYILSFYSFYVLLLICWLVLYLQHGRYNSQAQGQTEKEIQE